jgi:hypothetical protein
VDFAQQARLDRTSWTQPIEIANSGPENIGTGGRHDGSCAGDRRLRSAAASLAAPRASPTCIATLNLTLNDGGTTMRQRASGWWWMAVLGMLFVLGLGAPALAADATGTWKWSVERNGNVFESTLKLKQEGSTLTGTYIGRQSESPIEDGKIVDDVVSFKVTREFNGNKFVIGYEGKLDGDTIKGTSKFTRDGETQSRDWEAKRAK